MAPKRNQRWNITWAWVMTVSLVLVGFFLSVIASLQHAAFEVSRKQEEFSKAAAVAHHAIKHQVASGSYLARSVQAALSSSPEIGEDELWRVYRLLDPKAMLPGLQAVTYARRVSPQDGGPDRYIIELVFPREGNQNLVGMDLATQPGNMRALEKAHATGDTVLTEPFTLLQDQIKGKESADGMVIRIPVYSREQAVGDRDPAIGSIGISFRIGDMIDEAMAKGEAHALAIRLFDVTDGQKKLVYSRGEADEQWLISRGITMGGRQWQAIISPLKGTMDVSRGPLVTLVAGMLISSLLGLLVMNLTATREKARIMANDITRKYQDSEERFRILNEHLPGMAIVAKADGKIIYTNRVGRSILGLDDGNLGTLMELFNLPNLLVQIKKRPANTPYLTLPRIKMVTRSGKTFWASLSFASVKFHGRDVFLALGSDVSDIIELSERLELQSKQLHFQATHDQLTGLANRRDFETKLAAAITEYKKGGPAPALLYIDLDQFKIINDTAGHMAGDRLLVDASEGLRKVLKEDESVARLGGDEFGVLLPGASMERAIEVAESIRTFFDGFNFSWEGVNHQVTCSIGLARMHPDQSKEDFMAEADAACYMAKEKGRNRWHSSENDVDSIARRVEMTWVTRLRSAIAENRLQLYYQDILPIGSGDRPAGAHFEILLRLQEADGSLVPAGEFIPAAERYGLMGAIDRWTLDMAMRNFQRLHPSRDIGMCAINLSGQTISDPSFEPFLLDTVARWKVPPSMICLEITETAAINNLDRMMEFIPRLRAMGFRIALDDFGAGMSSFGYLKSLQSDIIKIDGSFVRDMDHDELSQSIVRAVTDISHKMGMQVVAEWVGSKKAVEHLQQLGVDFGQGFFLAHPLPCPIPSLPTRPGSIAQNEGGGHGS